MKHPRPGLTSRDEHLEDCKRRALEYLDAGDVQNAIASMLSDLNKHEDTKNYNKFLGSLGLTIAASGDIQQARRFIEGFR